MEGIPGQRMSLMDLKSIIEKKESQKMMSEFKARDREFSQISTQDTLSSKIINKDITILSNVNDFNYPPMRKFPNFKLSNHEEPRSEIPFTEKRLTKGNKKARLSYKENEKHKKDNESDVVRELKDKENEKDCRQCNDSERFNENELKSLENLELTLRIRACLGILRTESLYWIIKEFKEDDVYLVLKDYEFITREVLIEAIWRLINLSEDSKNVNV